MYDSLNQIVLFITQFHYHLKNQNFLKKIFILILYLLKSALGNNSYSNYLEKKIIKMIDQDYQMIVNQITKHVPRVEEISLSDNAIVGVIGPTGSGKSTFVSYLLQAKLKYQVIAKRGAKYIINHESHNHNYPVIGHQMKSCTFVPACYEIQDQVFVDLTGWYDTGSTNQQIVNSFSNSAIFKAGKKVKIVILVDIKSLQVERGGNLARIIQRLSQFFLDDLKQMGESILLVLSKVDTKNWTIKDATKEIQDIMKQNKNLTQKAIDLLQQIIENKNIIFFPTPDNISESKKEIKDIKKKIFKLEPYILSHDGRVALSAEAVNAVNSNIKKLNSEIAVCSSKKVQQIKIKVNEVKKNDPKMVNDMLSRLKCAYNIIKNQLGNSFTVRDEMKILSQLKEKLQISNELSQKMTKIFTMITFYQQLNGNLKIQSMFLESVSLQIAESITTLETLRQKITSEQQRKQMELRHKAEMEQRRKQIQKMIDYCEKRRLEAEQVQKKALQQQKNKYQQLLQNMNKKNTQVQHLKLQLTNLENSISQMQRANQKKRRRRRRI